MPKKIVTPTPSAAQVVKQLKAQADPANLDGMARFGMNVENRLGLSVPQMRQTAKELGRNHALALELWDTGIVEARIVAALIGDPAALTLPVINRWVNGIDSWDVCDQVCGVLFDKSALARAQIAKWSTAEKEFVKRAAYSTIAAVAWHDKTAPDALFIEYLGIIKDGADDDRNFVRKAVNWALRGIGKRNVRLNKAALKTAREIQRIDSKAARWIAADAIRELESDAIQKRFK